MQLPNLWLFDCEVYAYDTIFVFKNAKTDEYFDFHNDNEAVTAFMESHDTLLCGYNNKHYDSYILKSVLSDMTPEDIKRVNDQIIEEHKPGWEILRDCRIYFDQFDLMDDTQRGTSLKEIEGHLGMSIRETSVPFDIDRPLTEKEVEEVIAYCKYDVNATHILLILREVYISNKLKLAEEKGLEPAKALYMTNAKLTAAYLDAVPKEHNDEREYQFPDNLLMEYIPDEAINFFNQMHDKSIPDSDLWKRFITIQVGDCPTKIAWGGIHGAIPTYREESTEERVIVNADVGSYYPHLMILDGYSSRNIPSFDIYKDMLARRMKAKKAGDKSLANALKLVANTTYGAMGQKFNDLYDPLKFRSVCITGQLRLLELANNLLAHVPTLKVVQLNTDGIMCSFDRQYRHIWDGILQEWQSRTSFTLEEDEVKLIHQKDVNSYVEVGADGSVKVKGGYLVRGVLTNGNIDFTALGFPQWNNLMGGAFKINNNAVVVAKAVQEYIINGTPVEQTINASGCILDFQIISKTWQKCGNAYHMQFGEMVEQQRVNRVYATDKWEFGTLYMMDPDAGNFRKVTGVPEHLLVDNDNVLTIDDIDRDWYIRLAKKQVNDFLGIKERRDAKTTRKINRIKTKLIGLL